MDKNTIIGFLIIAALLFGYSWFSRPSQEEIESTIRYNDSIAKVEQKGLSAIDDTTASIAIKEDSLLNDSSFITNKLQTEFGEFSNAAAGKDSILVMQNSVVALQFSTKGGQLSEARLKEYQTHDSLPLILFNKEENNYGFIFKTRGRVIGTEELYFTPIKVNDSTLTMSLISNGGERFNIVYILPANSYMLDMKITQEGMDKVLPRNTANIDFYWNQRLRSQEKGRMFEERNSSIYYKFVGSEVDYLSETKEDKQTINLGIKWIGFKNQFFSSALIADYKFNGVDISSTPITDNDTYLKDFSLKSTIDYNPASKSGPGFKFFLGPNLYPLLHGYDKKLDEANKLKHDKLIPLGYKFFRWINTAFIIPIFTFLGKFISNYGVIILLLTLIIKIILAPLTYKSYMSTAKIRVLRPQIEEINQKFPGTDKAMDRQRATMDLYNRAGANPMSGCLPMLLQMPILLAMFAFFPSSIELRGEPFLWAQDLSSYD
ncbi:MAG: membrane protein insertase YidC, partial [Bacteroidales bacterium]